MQVDNHIPLPKKPTWKADLDKMKVNQSIKIGLAHKRSVRTAISQHFHTSLQKTFTTAKESPEYFRVWRVR